MVLVASRETAHAVQVRESAAAAGVRLGGENALPCFSPAHADAAALDRIVYNTFPWAPPLQVRFWSKSCRVQGLGRT